VLPAFIEWSHVLLRGLTGSLETSVFQMLSEGRTAQDVPGTDAARAVGKTPVRHPDTTTPIRTMRPAAGGGEVATVEVSTERRHPLRGSAVGA
jgi:hypothetical protein